MSMTMKKPPVGVSLFKDMVTGDYYYVDKTLFIKEIMDKGDKILLIPRPRRFGKTLNLSMLKYFYDCCPEEGGKGVKGTTAANSYKKLFDSLAISKAGQKYLDHMGKYPVIFLTFRDIKEMEWETCLDKIKQLEPATGKMYYTLAIPNMEVRTTYTMIVDNYFSGKIENNKLQIMLKALLEGDIDVFEEIFSDYVMTAMSFFDMDAEPEKVYHAFVMGLFLWLSPGYQVNSNRESGYGRYDIMIIPREKSKLGFIIEFKKTRKKETLESAVKSALAQLEEKKYEAELIDRGIKNIKKLAIVFKGKEVIVKEG